MTTASQTDAHHRLAPAPHSLAAERRHHARRALLAAIAAAPPPPALCWWLTPCGPWLSTSVARTP